MSNAGASSIQLSKDSCLDHHRTDMLFLNDSEWTAHTRSIAGPGGQSDQCLHEAGKKQSAGTHGLVSDEQRDLR